MIIKIVRYHEAQSGIASPAARARRCRRTAAGLARYVVEGELPDLSNIIVKEMTSERTHDDPIAAASNVSAYLTEHAGHPGRVRSTACSFMVGDDPQDWIDQMAIHAGSAGIEKLYHIIYSHRPDEPVTPAMMKQHRAIIRRTMNLDHCPGIGAMHGDEAHDHFHDLVVAVKRPDGGPPQVGQGWTVEAAHIAIAQCEFVSHLEAEPMRRYVADETGVYHFLTDTRVADADGRIVLDRTEMRTMQIDHDDIMRAFDPGGTRLHGEEWGYQEILEVLAKPRIQKAQNWEDVHRNLARVGMRYVVTGKTARVEFHEPGVPEKRAFAANAVYANAALGRLSDRFDEPFEPPPEDLWIRPFIAPRYDQRRDDFDGSAERQQAREEAKNLEACLKQDASRRRKDMNEAALGLAYNEKSARLAEAVRREKAAFKAVKLSATRKTQPRKAATPESGYDTHPFAMLWGEPTRSRNADDKDDADEAEELERRYRLERRSYGVEYWQGDQLAFVSYHNTIAVHAHDKQAKLDALRLAERRFGAVKVFGSRPFKDEMMALAIEHGIRLDAAQQREMERRKDSRRKQAEVDGDFETDTRSSPVLVREIAFAPMRRADLSERAERDRRIAMFDQSALDSMRWKNELEDEGNKGPNPRRTSVLDAHNILNAMDRDTLLLASSRYELEGIRYLDDEALMQALGGYRHAALRPEIQERLEAICRIQTRKREWICASLITGGASLQGGVLVTSLPNAGWAPAFFSKQRDDPVFQRMFADVKAGNLDVSHVDLTMRPELAVWHEARSKSANVSVIDAIATEHFKATSDVERDAMFKTMNDHDANDWRRTDGPVAISYRGWMYRRKSESESQWQQRIRTAQISDRQQGR